MSAERGGREVHSLRIERRFALDDDDARQRRMLAALLLLEWRPPAEPAPPVTPPAPAPSQAVSDAD